MAPFSLGLAARAACSSGPSVMKICHHVSWTRARSRSFLHFAQTPVFPVFMRSPSSTALTATTGPAVSEVPYSHVWLVIEHGIGHKSRAKNRVHRLAHLPSARRVLGEAWGRRLSARSSEVAPWRRTLGCPTSFYQRVSQTNIQVVGRRGSIQASQKRLDKLQNQACSQTTPKAGGVLAGKLSR